MKILFADLDGTIIKTKSGNTFSQDPNDWELIPGIREAIMNYLPDVFHIVSNQGGIALGKVRRDDFDRKLINVFNTLNLPHNIKTSSDYCASLSKNDPRRKPNPGMILDFLKHHPGNHECLMIGDASGKPGQFSDSDLVAAKNAGINYLDISDFLRRYN